MSCFLLAALCGGPKEKLQRSCKRIAKELKGDAGTLGGRIEATKGVAKELKRRKQRVVMELQKS